METYLQYLDRVLSNDFSLNVKLADLEHNMSDLGLGNLLDKYQVTDAYLRQNSCLLFDFSMRHEEYSRLYEVALSDKMKKEL